MAPTSATADDYTPKIIPKCEIYTVGGLDICGYRYKGLPDPADEDWNKVLAADAELVHLREELKNEERKSASLAQQVRLLAGQGKIYADSQKVLVKRVDEVTKDLIGMNLKYENERAKPRLGSPVAWTVAAVVTAVLIGFVVKDRLD
jgi:hypothetical protein